jgi:DNA-directed RNA polymerase subunit RPC12/RpoP
MNYRNDARRYLKRAEEELGTRDDERLKYAVLELRMAMEALTYDRLLAYKDEFPPSEYETWQPRKVLSVLLDIDPTADKDSSLAFGKEEEYAVPPCPMNSLGSERVLNMAALRRHYDALGHYLHVQTMKQVLAGTALDFGKIRSRCEEIVAFIAAVLSSPVFNVTLGSFATLNCVECGKPIRKRIPHGQAEVHAQCYGCGASYTLLDNGDGQVEWQPEQREIECANGNCKHKILVWLHEMEVGKYWKCPGCGGRNVFALGICYEAVQ